MRERRECGRTQIATQGLKPQSLAGSIGRAEAVPSPKPGDRVQFRLRSRRVVEVAVVVFAVFLFLGAGDSDARFKDLGHRMMCTCGCGQILLECNHVGCQSSDKMRNQLLAALDRGDNDDLVLQGFVQEYGPTVVAAPGTTGFNYVAWVMPFVALGLGMAFVVVVVRAWKNKPAPAIADGIRLPRHDELDEFKRKAREETDL